MSTGAHILSASYLTLVATHTLPAETSLIVLSLISAGVLDLDHLFLLIRNRGYFKSHGYAGHLHKARSPLHEMVGFFVVGTVMLVISFYDARIALILGLPALIHLVEDIILGISIPFNPIDKTEVHLVPQVQKTKIMLDFTVIAVFAFLWMQYLNVNI